jgi:hypothetical protein
MVAEFGDDKNRYADAKARKNYAGTSPITRQSGKKKTVLARHVHNDRLLDALGLASLRRPAPARSTTNSGPAEPVTAPRFANSATASSVYSTAASSRTASTTRTPRGRIANKIKKLRLDNLTDGMS